MDLGREEEELVTPTWEWDENSGPTGRDPLDAGAGIASDLSFHHRQRDTAYVHTKRENFLVSSETMLFFI